MDAGAIVRAGRTRPLTAPDAPPLDAELAPRRAEGSTSLPLTPFWPFLLRLFFSTGGPARSIVTLTFVRLAIACSAPLLLHELLAQLPAARHAASFPFGLLGLALLLGSAGMSTALLTQHWYHSALRIRTCITNTLNHRVVAHALRLRRSARARMETGDLINHLGSDTDALAEAGFFVSEAFNALLTMLVAFAALSFYLGWAAVVAVAALAVLTPFTALLGARFRRLDERIMGIRDKRATLMSQIVHGIRVVKYHAWEPSVHAEVQSIRRPEIRTRIGVVSSDVFASAIWVSTATVVAFAGFGAFVLLGGTLSAPLVFACLALFAMLEEPFGLISHILARLQHARVASQRLHAYFEAPERTQDQRVIATTAEAQPLRCSDVAVHYAGAAAPALELPQLEVGAGEAVAIVGPVGSGKSTLLRVLGGIQLPSRGSATQLGESRARLAYVPQEAFTLNASLRANIEFGAPEHELLDEHELAAIVSDCALLPDLAALPSGLDTEIGERGVNLSGGQKQRVALARAAYRRPGIVLLDDPLSAVDVHTEDVLVERLLFRRLRSATRVVVTHRLTHLARFDRVVFVVAGRVLGDGRYDELLRDNPDFRSFCTSTAHLESTPAHTPEPQPVVASSGDPNEGRVTEDEDRATGAVRWPVYRDYLRALVGDRPLLAPALLAALPLTVAVVAVLPLLQRIWFARFTDRSLEATAQQAVLIYGAIGLAVLVCSIGQRFLWLYRAAAAGRTIHDRALAGVLAAPLRFFDSTPTGRILNRFARDLEAVDDELSWSIEQACRSAASTLATLVLILTAVPILLFVALPVIAIYYLVQHAFRRVAREARRLESIARSPRYAQFKEVVTGLDVIHAYGREQFFLDQFFAILEHYQRMHWCSIKLNRWFGTRMGLIGGLLSLCTCVAIVVLSYTGSMSAGTAGLVLSYALGLWGALNWTVRALSEVETFMTQAERLQHYARLTPEPLTTAPALPDSTPWPTRGTVEFREVAARYAPHLPRVLDGVTFRVEGGSKAGLIGRTGAGKSTVSQALFRFIAPERGAILVDGVDIATIPLPRLRRAFAIIPQDPTLFAGTVRSNLDRFGTCSDDDVWTALRRVQLEPSIRALPGMLDARVIEHGHNFSQGQRQLLCMARAILTRARVIVLDEATASVDVRTDRSIQETVRSEFRDVTVLVIAHRLNTLADADQILELAHGRVVRSTDRNSSIPVRRRDAISQPG
ncbi:MAG TPA: ABC transporter transmembrane domain-containing protein [Polyangiales bacterium]|nr:ABC transporter transmembrane domain-containing protein [Polyangiales bacterium]